MNYSVVGVDCFSLQLEESLKIGETWAESREGKTEDLPLQFSLHTQLLSWK